MMSINYTIVEPGFEFIPPPDETNYLEFLELCTRVCYKSEGYIKPGSAEKLMNKVVKAYEHYSVTEHANCIIRINMNIAEDTQESCDEYLKLFNETLRNFYENSMLRAEKELNGLNMIVSGNVRMWLDWLKKITHIMGFDGDLKSNIQHLLHQKWPFFFNKAYHKDISKPLSSNMQLIDENPITNYDNLSQYDMEKHMTLTCKIIGDRTMSHQLVRHRMGAYSQESQRYCNYGKKGFQLIMPPTIANASESARFAWLEQVKCNFKLYQGLMKEEKIPPEDARSILPNCTKTEVVTTYTLDQWKHLFEHRGHNSKAQWQIREIMLGIEKKFQELVPDVFNES